MAMELVPLMLSLVVLVYAQARLSRAVTVLRELAQIRHEVTEAIERNNVACQLAREAFALAEYGAHAEAVEMMDQAIALTSEAGEVL